jgi:hypothetical protein
MSDYNDDYFFIRKPKNNSLLPFLSPDENTEDRRYRFEAQPLGSPPLVFHNTWKEENLKKRVKSISPEVLFEGDDLVVSTAIREKLLLADIPELHMHPAIYIDDQEKWHEDYWFLTFTKWVDCWDRNTSTYEQDDPPVVLGGFELHQVYQYSFDPKVLDKIPMPGRLLFKLGGSLDGFIVCHKSLAGLFRANGKSGVELVGIRDY